MGSQEAVSHQLLSQSQLPPWLPLAFVGICLPLGPTGLSQKETRHVHLFGTESHVVQPSLGLIM